MKGYIIFTFYIACSYDIILDCANQGPDVIKPKGIPHNSYISLNSPILRNIDEHGLLLGTVRNVGDIIKHNISKSDTNGFVKYGFFTPSPMGIDMLQSLVENGQVKI